MPMLPPGGVGRSGPDRSMAKRRTSVGAWPPVLRVASHAAECTSAGGGWKTVGTITANQPFGGWDSIFPDPTMTVAAIDCLVHHSIILEMNTDSYRRTSAETKPRRKFTGSAA
jgi:hypothetical protein